MEFTSTFDRSEYGPFDSLELGTLENFVDCGALLFPRSNDEVKIRVDVEEGTGRLVALTLQHQESFIQVSAYSAPKSDGIWPEVFLQLKAAADSQDGDTVIEEYSFGPSILATLPISDDDNAGTTLRRVRLIGVDGPRWFLRGMIWGDAVSDRVAANVIDSLFKSVVVRRGDEALPPKERLELTMPPGQIAPPRGF
jgi:hypothetical protein